MKGLETTARELASSVVERGEVDCFKERDGQADASALTLAATSSDATRVCDATALKVPAGQRAQRVIYSDGVHVRERGVRSECHKNLSVERNF